MNSRPFLVLSLVLNVCLVGIAVWLLSTRQKTVTPVEQLPTEASTSSKPFLQSGANGSSSIAPWTNEVVKIDWRMVESENYKQYIANLRSIGCPEETIRDIITADVNKLFEARRKELYPNTNKFEYWKGGNFFASLFDEKRMERDKALSAEKRALLKELLGTDVPESLEIATGAKAFEAMLDFLPADKQTQLMELEQKFAGRMAKSLKDIQRGDMDAMKKIQAEKDAEMLKILSPEDKFEYDLRMSQTAMIMRMQMGDVEMNEGEFRELFKLRKQFEDEFGMMGTAATRGEERIRRDAAQKEIDAETRKLLGDDRFFEVKYSGDFGRSSLNKIAEEHKVPRSSALRVFDIRAAAQEEAQRVRGDMSLSPDQRQAKLDQIRQLTEQTIGETIGAPARDAYVKDGSWIKNLNRAATPPQSE